MNHKEMMKQYEDKEIKSVYLVYRELMLMLTHTPRDNVDSDDIGESILSELTIGKFPHELRMEVESERNEAII